MRKSNSIESGWREIEYVRNVCAGVCVCVYVYVCVCVCVGGGGGGGGVG